jgi:predicted O-methyltransferase YrrM
VDVTRRKAATAPVPATRARPVLLPALCNRLAHASLPSDYQLLDAAGLASGHPWAFLAQLALDQPGSVAYYRYLYGLVRVVDPVRILEIGTAFGLSGAAFILGAPRLRKLISLDLGVFGAQYDAVERSGKWDIMERYRTEEIKADGGNISFAREALRALAARTDAAVEISLHQVNTQPVGTDNFDVVANVPRWFEVPELLSELQAAAVDLLFIDGKHTGDGLYQDFRSFFKYVRPGGLVICDDVHDTSFVYNWAGQTLESFRRIEAEFNAEIEESLIWPFPQLPDAPGQEPTVRPFGLIRKKGPASADGNLDVGKRLILDELTGVGAEGSDRWLRFLRQHGELASRIQTIDADGRGAERVRFMAAYPGLCTAVDELGFSDEQAQRVVRFLFMPGHLPLFEELEGFGLGESTIRRLKFLADNAELFAELERFGLDDRLWSRLTFIKDHPALFESLQQSGLGEAAARRLGFLNDHAELFAELEGSGLDDRLASRLAFIKNHPALFEALQQSGLAAAAAWRLSFLNDHAALFAALEDLGLTDSATRWLRFFKEHTPLFQELEGLGFTDSTVHGLTDSASRLLRFVKEHPAFVGYLAARPTLADDLDRHIAGVSGGRGAAPNVRLAWKLLPGWISGRYRWEGR